MRTEEPRAIHLADYKAPDFRIETVHLDFALDPQATRVTARLEIVRKTAHAPLVLHGEELKLISLTLDGRAVSESEYRLDAKSLTIAWRPDVSPWKPCARSRPLPIRRWKGSISRPACSAPNASRKASAASPISSTGPTISPSSRPASKRRRSNYPVLLSNGNPDRGGRSCGWPAFRASGTIPSPSRAICSRWSRAIWAPSRTASSPCRAARWRWPSMSSTATSRASPTRWIRSSARCAGTKRPMAANTISTSS